MGPIAKSSRGWRKFKNSSLDEPLLEQSILTRGPMYLKEGDEPETDWPAVDTHVIQTREALLLARTDAEVLMQAIKTNDDSPAPEEPSSDTESECNTGETMADTTLAVPGRLLPMTSY